MFGRVETRKNQALKNMALWDTIDGWWKSFDVRGASSFVVAEN